jgi:hypothetical protein
MSDVSVASGSIFGAVESRAERSRVGAGAAAGGEVTQKAAGRDLLSVDRK